MRNGVPVYAVAAASISFVLAYMNINTSAATVFGYLVSLVTVFALLNWLSILLSYFSFRRALKIQGIPLSDLPYRAPLQPYGAMFSLFWTIVIILFNGQLYPSSPVHFSIDLLSKKSTNVRNDRLQCLYT